ncbi:MAG: nucleotidyl transferase AbiEii/AbiGii toxin family protein, partial [Propionibacteriales bacterium]|nr:nucleotidyl transferase AbiEii/AbiGii toxin family protein [Propionibacteriales bacterium]
PTVESFAGWKTAAWHDRAAARDLYDLWALAERGSLTAAAAELFAKHGPTGGRPRSHMFTKPPSESAWQAQLAAQTRLVVSAAGALAVVRRAWATAQGERWQ